MPKRIGLVAVDGHKFPNLALMKISAYHKRSGDSVEFADPMFGVYDVVYQSKVFTFSPDDTNFYHTDQLVKAGTGYGDYTTQLPTEIEHICPDYSLYPISDSYDGKTAYGFLTRGCIRKCKWCVVPHKEGTIKAHARIEEFIGSHRKAVLLDNNILASDWGLNEIEKIVADGITVDFNQGLDARIIAENKDIAHILSRVKWINYLRMAYDCTENKDSVFKAIQNLKNYGVPGHKMFFYVLVKDDILDAERRVIELDEVGAVPFAQPYRDFSNNKEPLSIQKDFARWVNMRATFKSCAFRDYQPRKGFYCSQYFA